MDIDPCRSYDTRKTSALEDPFTLVRHARETCPVAHSDQQGGFWNFFKYADVTHAARTPDVYLSGKGITIPTHGLPGGVPPMEKDPPEHKFFRTPLLEQFSPQSIARFEPAIRGEVTKLIDDFIEVGEADLASQLTAPMPAVVVTHLLGLPLEDRDKLHNWAVRMLSLAGDHDAVRESVEYLAALYPDRKSNPRDDIPTLLVDIDINGRPITEMEYTLLIHGLFVAGLDTTTNAAANSLIILSDRPDLRDFLIEDFDRLPNAIEELLRYVTPLPGNARTTACPVTVGGVEIPEDTKVQLHWLSANHDPDEFPDPETIDLERAPNRHVTFGIGIHRCLGMHLARLQLRVLFEEVLTRIPDFKVDKSRVRRTESLVRNVAELPAMFTPGQRIGS